MQEAKKNTLRVLGFGSLFAVAQHHCNGCQVGATLPTAPLQGVSPQGPANVNTAISMGVGALYLWKGFNEEGDE